MSSIPVGPSVRKRNATGATAPLDSPVAWDGFRSGASNRDQNKRWQNKKPRLAAGPHELSVLGDNNTLVTLTNAQICDGTFPQHPGARFPTVPEFRVPV